MPNPKGNPNIKKYGIPQKGTNAFKKQITLRMTEEMYYQLVEISDSIPDFIRQAILEKLEKLDDTSPS